MAPDDGVNHSLPNASEQERPLSPERLDSWKEIAAYLKRSVRTVRRWEAEEALPVHRHLHQSSGSVYAFNTEIDAWVLSRRVEVAAARASLPEITESDVRLRPIDGLRRGVRLAGAVVVTALLAALGLWRIGSVTDTGPDIHRLAVLPLENLTGDPAQEYIADGMTDALITELAQSGGPMVISRTSVVQYKNATKSLPAIARELRVEGIVSGAVVASGSSLGIRVVLFYAPTDRPLWAESYERGSSDLVGLQREVAQAIASAVVGNLKRRTRETGAESKSISAEATQLFYKSLLAGSAENSEGLWNGITLCQQAIDKQPDFALAYARMAYYYLQLSFTGQSAPTALMPEAERAALTALRLDQNLAEAHRVLAQVFFRFKWDWSGSERASRRALAINPSGGRAAFSIFLSAMDRSQEAISEAKQAQDLDPLSLQPILSLAQAYRAAGDYDRAIGEFRRGLDRDPAPRAHFQLGMTYVQRGMLREGIDELETALKLTPNNTRVIGYLAYAYARAGRQADAKDRLEALLALANRQYVSPLAIARIYAGLGINDAALDWLEKAYQARDIDFVAPGTNPDLADLRSNPHYREFFIRIAANH